MPGFTGEDFAILKKLGIVHGSFSSDNDIELIDRFGFFQKIGSILARLDMVIIEDNPIASHDRRCFACNLNCLLGFAWRARLTLTAAALLLLRTTSTKTGSTSASATATTIAVTIRIS
jgi:hypothetical protein